MDNYEQTVESVGNVSQQMAPITKATGKKK